MTIEEIVIFMINYYYDRIYSKYIKQRDTVEKGT